MSLDNATTDAYTCVTIAAPDRKGLVYDLMRTVKDIRLRVAFARVGRAPPQWRAPACTFPPGPHEAHGQRIPAAENCSVGTLRVAVAATAGAARWLPCPLGAPPPGHPQRGPVQPADQRLRQRDGLVRAAQVVVTGDGVCEADLFVQHVDGGRVHDECAPRPRPPLTLCARQGSGRVSSWSEPAQTLARRRIGGRRPCCGRLFARVALQKAVVSRRGSQRLPPRSVEDSPTRRLVSAGPRCRVHRI